MRRFASREGVGSRLTDTTVGRFLAFLAVYVQLLLPFFVVVDLRIAEPASGAFPICRPDGGSTPGTPDSGHSPACCPLCLALGAGAPATAPPPAPTLPLRGDAKRVAAEPVAAAAVRNDSAVNYEARGPPLNS
jgi:hypothetical protein